VYNELDAFQLDAIVEAAEEGASASS